MRKLFLCFLSISTSVVHCINRSFNSASVRVLITPEVNQRSLILYTKKIDDLICLYEQRFDTPAKKEMSTEAAIKPECY